MRDEYDFSKGVRRSLWDSLSPEQRERALRPVEGPEVCGSRADHDALVIEAEWNRQVLWGRCC